MRLREKEKNKIINYGEDICAYFAIDYNHILLKKRTKEVSVIMSLLFNIVHYDMGISVSCMSDIYGRGCRNIFEIINRGKFYIKTYSEYRCMYETIKREFEIPKIEKVK